MSDHPCHGKNCRACPEGKEYHEDTILPVSNLERRGDGDPYCPSWCRYGCVGAWKTGNCLIRTCWANKRFAAGEIAHAA